MFNAVGTYTVTLSANNGYGICNTTYSLLFDIIPDGDIYIPNVFTPNGDGANDVFAAMGAGISLFDLQLFDRWGKIIKTFTSISDTWNGKDKNGIDAPEGVYVYKLFVKMNDGRQLERGGSVTLLR